MTFTKPDLTAVISVVSLLTFTVLTIYSYIELRKDQAVSEVETAQHIENIERVTVYEVTNLHPVQDEVKRLTNCDISSRNDC